MNQFKNGVYYDYYSGQVKFYMNRPKNLDKSLKGKTIKIDGIDLAIDEFYNKAGVQMLSFSGIVRRRFNDYQSAIIYLRCRITNEIQSLSVRNH